MKEIVEMDIKVTLFDFILIEVEAC